MISLALGDMFTILPTIKDQSVNLIYTDPPYGNVTSTQDWDIVPNLEQMWVEFKRILVPYGTVVVHSAQPFTTDLIASNRKMFKYSWVWVKTRPGGFMNCHFRPIEVHEDICVFSDGGAANGARNLMQYHAQGLIADGTAVHNTYGPEELTTYRPRRPSHHDHIREWTNWPKSVLRFPNDNKTVHATQKPIKLAEYLVQTYSNADDLVVDPFLGSATAALACANTGRNFFGCEKDQRILTVAEKRLCDNAVGYHRMMPQDSTV